MKIERIILDLDDTLNSLTMPILRHFGCDVGPFDYEKFPTEVGYNVITACDVLGGTLPDSVPEFWDEVTRADIWRTAPKSKECDYIIQKSVELVGEENVGIATHPTRDSVSHGHKLEWILNNLPEFIDRQYQIGPRKHWMSKPGVLLIDDHLENCLNWKDDLNNGGPYWLLPRPWNPIHSVDTMSFLERKFDALL